MVAAFNCQNQPLKTLKKDEWENIIYFSIYIPLFCGFSSLVIAFLSCTSFPFSFFFWIYMGKKESCFWFKINEKPPLFTCNTKHRTHNIHSKEKSNPTAYYNIFFFLLHQIIPLLQKFIIINASQLYVYVFERHQIKLIKGLFC